MIIMQIWGVFTFFLNGLTTEDRAVRGGIYAKKTRPAQGRARSLGWTPTPFADAIARTITAFRERKLL